MFGKTKSSIRKIGLSGLGISVYHFRKDYITQLEWLQHQKDLLAHHKTLTEALDRFSAAQNDLELLKNQFMVAEKGKERIFDNELLRNKWLEKCEKVETGNLEVDNLMQENNKLLSYIFENQEAMTLGKVEYIEMLNKIRSNLNTMADKSIQNTESVSALCKYLTGRFDEIYFNNFDFNIFFELINNMAPLINNMAPDTKLNFINIFSGIVILTSVFSISSALFGNFLVTYFNLERRFPKIRKILHFRKKFVMFNVIFNLLLIFVVILISLYCNLFHLGIFLI